MHNFYNLEVNNDEAITHLPFFPSIAWLSFAEKQKEISIDIYETFPKQTFRNRILLMSSNGLQAITVPVQRDKHEKILTKDAKISYKENWNIRLWRAIYSNYGNSPYFEYYSDEIKNILLKEFEYLLDLNVEVFMFLKKCFSLSCNLNLTDKFVGSKENNYLNSFSIKTRKSDGVGFPPYIQCFYEKIPFEENLSSLDLLLCLGGREGREYLLKN